MPSPREDGESSTRSIPRGQTTGGKDDTPQVEVVDAIEPLAAEWDALADGAGAEPFVRPGWISAWRSAFGHGRLAVYTVRDREGSLTGVLPLERRRGTLRSPTNAHTPTFGAVAVDRTAALRLARSVFGSRVPVVTLEWLDAEDVWAEVFREAAGELGYRGVEAVVARAPVISCAASLAEHERGLGRNLRHDVERRMRRLAEAGAVTFQVRESLDDLEAVLEEGFGVEALGWKGTEGTAIAASESTRRFYADVARWAAARGWLRLLFLRLDGRPIAFQLDLEVGDTYYSLKIGYDPAFERYAPGKLLLHAATARAVVRGLSSYELLGSDEPWKRRWTEAYRTKLALRFFAGSASGRLAEAAFVRARPLVRRMPLASRAAARLRG